MRFLVIGDSCTDRFVYGTCDRICPEAPVPVFTPVKEKINGGMAKNVQSNVEALDVECDILTNSNEIFKTRYVDIKTNQMLLRVDENDESEDEFNYKGISWTKYDAVIVSDYEKGFLKGCRDIKDICQYHDNVFWDSNKCRIEFDLPQNLTFLKINQYELEVNPHLKHHLDPRMHPGDYTRPNQIIVTYGHKGCKYMGKMYAPPERVVTQDLSGAGDTFMAALAVSMTRVGDAEDAIKFANECSATVVAKRGVTTI